MAGVDAPLTWAVLFFFLNFIPGVGFFVALVPPALLALLEHGWQRAVVVILGWWVVNLIGDNVIKPRFFVKGLDLSFTTLVFAVVFWSWVLGPAGGSPETTVTGVAAPGSSRFTAVSCAKYSVSPRNAIPEGSLRPVSSGATDSATPSPFASTSRTICPDPDCVAYTAPPGPSARKRTPPTF